MGVVWGPGLFLPTGSISHPLDAVQTLVSHPSLEPWVWDRTRGLLVNRPCVPCGAGSLQLLSHLPDSPRSTGCMGQLLPFLPSALKTVTRMVLRGQGQLCKFPPCCRQGAA